TITYTQACYGCYMAAGIAWPDDAVDDACEAHTTRCTACDSFEACETCTVCSSFGEILPRNLMAHHYLSSPGCAGDYAEHLGFVLPIIPLTETADPYW